MNFTKTHVRFALIFALMVATSQSQANCIPNNSPFHQFHHIPCLSNFTSEPAQSVRYSLERANIFYHEGGHVLDEELAVVDGEIRRQVLTVRKSFGITNIGAELIEFNFMGGQLDAVIEDWHNGLNLVNWDREEYPQNQLEFRYENQEQKFLLNRSGGWKRVAVYGAISVPEMELVKHLEFGSSRTIGYSELASHHSYWLALGSSQVNWNSGISINARAGVSYAERFGMLKGIQIEHVYFGHLQARYSLRKQLALVGQLQSTTAQYESDTKILGSPYVSWIMGIDWTVIRHHRIALSVAEDIGVGTSPDVTFQFAYEVGF